MTRAALPVVGFFLTLRGLPGLGSRRASKGPRSVVTDELRQHKQQKHRASPGTPSSCPSPASTPSPILGFAGGVGNASTIRHASAVKQLQVGDLLAAEGEAGDADVCRRASRLSPSTAAAMACVLRTTSLLCGPFVVNSGCGDDASAPAVLDHPPPKNVLPGCVANGPP